MTRSLLVVAPSVTAFIVVSLLAYFVTLLAADRAILSVLIGAFCGFAAATVLNVTHVVAHRTRRSRENGDPLDPGNGREDRPAR